MDMRSAEATVRQRVESEAGAPAAATTAPLNPFPISGLPRDPLGGTWLEQPPGEEPDWGSLGYEQQRPPFDSSGAPIASAGVWPPEGMLEVTGPGPVLAGLLNQVDLG